MEVRSRVKNTNVFELYGIFGHPLSHSLSPAMQEKAFSKIGKKAYYITLELDLAGCREAFRGLRTSLLSGFNVTVPYKQEVLRWLDRLTPEARSAGAVNTVYRRAGKWIGTNTDIYGFLRALEKDARFSVPGKKAVVLGAGGAARAVVYGLLAERASSVVVLNRNAGRAENLVSEFAGRQGRVKLSAGPLTKEAFSSAAADADLVVNATSGGLRRSDPPVVPGSWIPAAGKKRRLFFDLIYRPAETRFLREAKRKGHRTMNGVGMLVYQGARAFELWTGKRAPEALMRRELLDRLAEEKKSA